MSSPPRRSLQTRGSNRPTRNALHPPRGARSAVACRALSSAPAPSRARQPGLPRGPRAVARPVRYAPLVARAGQRDGPIFPAPASPPRRPPPPLASPPPVGCRVPRRRRRPRGGPLAHRGPRSTTAGVVKPRRGRRRPATTMATQHALHNTYDTVVTCLRVRTPPPPSATRTRVPAFALSPG